MKKASEVIKELKKLKRKHGDQYVEVHDTFWRKGITVSEIYLVEEEDYKYFKIR